MAETSKYPPEELTDEERSILDNVVSKYALKYYALTQIFPDPKVYAKKVILKRLLSDKYTEFLYTATYAKTFPLGHIFQAGEINEKLKNDLRNTIQQDYVDSLEDEANRRKLLLSPRDLRERILKKLEKDGIFIHLEEKGKIRGRRRESSRPGKKSSDDAKFFRGGRLSEYKVSENIEKLKQVMDKEGALDYVQAGVINSGLAQRLAKYQMQAFLHAAKTSEKVLQRSMVLGAAFMQAGIQDKDISNNSRKAFEKLQTLSNDELEQFADSIAANLIASTWYYQVLGFVTSFLKL